MNDKLVDSILAVCRVLNHHGVEYLTVGGTAVALHGFYRLSTNPAGAVADKPDLDFWYNPTYRNYFNLLKALEALGQDVRSFKEEQAPNPKKSFLIGLTHLESYNIDYQQFVFPRQSIQRVENQYVTNQTA